MDPHPRDENTLSLEEATEELAQAEGMDLAEFQQAAEEFEIGPLEEAEILEVSDE